ncbi:hypothetical protein PPL_04029 [Heterostelium album PN500]|uniref:SPX domain-containing protein n=1 Tax=Heterostelium pallidum (strain ATCC 26659 / Pp 5 / PN500) TaxID=670386 RepID=D3B5U1_HETP5|nr:hypothetical protein PPL_04029 [Heterostelium album PN500]EFA83239.1 hypothetical protein PPL_04029 [Heterostelium album PN500]|eukprot:XP_020435356.1 hypothetical protein PPL_04029 [Heterostelium album PN500]
MTEEWEANYVDYKELKKLLMELCDDKNNKQTTPVHRTDRNSTFLRSLWKQFQKIDKFITDNERDIAGKVKHLEKTQDATGIVATMKDLERLLSFVELNQEGIRKILKKYDKKATSTIGYEYYCNMVRPHFQSKLAILTHYNKCLLKTYSSQFGDPSDITVSGDQSESVFSLAFDQ